MSTGTVHLVQIRNELFVCLGHPLTPLHCNAPRPRGTRGKKLLNSGPLPLYPCGRGASRSERVRGCPRNVRSSIGIHLIYGMQGADKSTLAARLARQHGAVSPELFAFMEGVYEAPGEAELADSRPLEVTR